MQMLCRCWLLTFNTSLTIDNFKCSCSNHQSPASVTFPVVSYLDFSHSPWDLFPVCGNFNSLISMYKNNRWLLLLPCISLLLLVSFNKMIRKKLWQADPYLRRKARVEQACRDFKEQIERDEEKRARTEHPPDIHFKSGGNWGETNFFKYKLYLYCMQSSHIFHPNDGQPLVKSWKSQQKCPFDIFWFCWYALFSHIFFVEIYALVL